MFGQMVPIAIPTADAALPGFAPLKEDACDVMNLFWGTKKEKNC